MVLGFGETKSAPKKRPDDIPTLIAKKEYARAIQVLRFQLEKNRHDSRLRLQLADLLVLTGKNKEAVAILTPLADEFAAEGFALAAKPSAADSSARGVRIATASLFLPVSTSRSASCSRRRESCRFFSSWNRRTWIARAYSFFAIRVGMSSGRFLGALLVSPKPSTMGRDYSVRTTS